MFNAGKDDVKCRYKLEFLSHIIPICLERFYLYLIVWPQREQFKLVWLVNQRLGWEGGLVGV